MIDEILAEFLQSGLGLHVGTRNERLEPSGCRATAIKVEDDGRHVVVYVPKAASPQIFENLRTNGRVAVSMARPVDERAVQVKVLVPFSWDPQPEARAFEPESGRVLEVLTDRPGIQLYTANFLPADGIECTGGVKLGRHGGFCLETQNFPDAINKPGFPKAVLRPGETYDTTTVFRFATR